MSKAKILHLPVKKNSLTEDEEKRTMYLFGKPYHWELTENGYLRLAPGMTDYEKLRADAVQMLLDKGMPAEDITREIIEEVVAKAESAAIMAQLGDESDAPQS